MKSRQKIKSENVKSEIPSDQNVELLKELHLLTSAGELNADARRKLKQVNHLVQLIKPAWDDVASRHTEINLVDVGAGKSYLGFILYDALAAKLMEVSQRKPFIYSIESRADLVTRAEDMAKRLKFENMKFLAQTIEKANGLPERVHMLTALHACDIATDDAIILGLEKKVDYMALVPCCQAEVARLLQDAKGEIPQLWKHGIHKREFGSHLTNVIRSLVLESLGYQVTVTELVGWEHSLKNEFILAKRVQNENPRARAQLDELLSQIPVRPKLVRQLFG